MKYIFISLLGIYCLSSFIETKFFLDGLFWFNSDDKYLSPAARAVNEIQYQTASSIAKKFKIEACGLEVAMPDNIVKEIGISFEAPGKLSKRELAKLLFQFGEELLHNINSNQAIQPFLEHKPFTLKDVTIIIFNSNKGKDLYDPEISVARLSDGLIIFKTDDPDIKYAYKNITQEKYEDVLKRLQNENDGKLKLP